MTSFKKYFQSNFSVIARSVSDEAILIKICRNQTNKTKKESKMSFKKISEITAEAKKKNLEFWEAVLQDDMKERNVSKDESFRKMEKMFDAMAQADKTYSPNLRSQSGLSGGDGAKLEIFRKQENRLIGTFLTMVMEKAVKMGESNACMKRIVAAPTAGSCGVIPAVLLTYYEQKNPPKEKIIKSLYVAAGIGQAIANTASISGAEGGCQAEIGSASAMAAGALTYLESENESESDEMRETEEKCEAFAGGENQDKSETDEKQDTATKISESEENEEIRENCEASKSKENCNQNKNELRKTRIEETNNQIANAAALALKNMLGLTCDPVAGLVEIPCIKRNVSGAVNAIIASQMTKAGIKSAIPADEVIESMGRIGSLIPPCLKETSQEGLAATATAQKIAEKMQG